MIVTDLCTLVQNKQCWQNKSFLNYILHLLKFFHYKTKVYETQNVCPHAWNYRFVNL